MRASAFLSGEDKRAVEAAIAGAERQTAAEIVCAVATESGRYDRAESIVGLAGALLFLSLAHLVHGGSAAWGAASPPLGWQALAVALGFVCGTLAASYAHALRRVFVSAREMEEETLRAAWAVFAHRRLGSTRKRAGVLLYLSLFERRGVVVADDGALAALGQPGVETLRDLLVEGARAGRGGDALSAAAQQAGSRLAARLPPDARNPNEIPNQVLIYHPRP